MMSGLLLVDLGGTKTFYGVLPSNATSTDDFYFRKVRETIKGKKGLYQLFSTILDDISKQSKVPSGCHISQVLIACPGRIIDGVISPGSCNNMSIVQGELDGLDLISFLAPLFAKNTRLTVMNDAEAQMAGGVIECLQDESLSGYVLDQTVGYIGPGTGLGGGFCEVDSKGRLQFITDGHLYDVRMTDSQGSEQKAEDLISGRAFKTITGYSAKQMSDSRDLFLHHIDDISRMGAYIVSLIQLILEGHIFKSLSQNDWPLTDIDKVKGCRTFLLGGSLGTKGYFGEALQTAIQICLDESDLEDVHVVPLPDSDEAPFIGLMRLRESLR